MLVARLPLNTMYILFTPCLHLVYTLLIRKISAVLAARSLASEDVPQAMPLRSYKLVDA